MRGHFRNLWVAFEKSDCAFSFANMKLLAHVSLSGSRIKELVCETGLPSARGEVFAAQAQKVACRLNVALTDVMARIEGGALRSLYDLVVRDPDVRPSDLAVRFC